MRTYTDDELAEAVAASRSWRGVLRTVGVQATSSSALRSARRRADRLDLDYTHFTGQRRWSEQQLADAVATCRTWAEVNDQLGISRGSSTSVVRGHALRLNLDVAHLTRPVAPPRASGKPDRSRLRRAGTLIAAAWFELVGDQISWPLEPCRYDLVVWRDAGAERIQVKTTTRRSGASWEAQITDSGSSPYDPDEIDQFFIVDGDLRFYLIPVGTVGGLQSIVMSAYEAFSLPPLSAFS